MPLFKRHLDLRDVKYLKIYILRSVKYIESLNSLNHMHSNFGFLASQTMMENKKEKKIRKLEY